MGALFKVFKFLFLVFLTFYSLYQINNSSKYKNRVKSFAKYLDETLNKRGYKLDLGDFLKGIEEELIYVIYGIALLGICLVSLKLNQGYYVYVLAIYMECLILNNPFIMNKEFARNNLIILSLLGGVLQ